MTAIITEFALMKNASAKKDLRVIHVRYWNAVKTAAIEANAEKENAFVKLGLWEK